MSSLLGTAPAGTPWPGRTRPLCAWPAQARYTGHGSVEDAGGFVCARPDDDPPGDRHRGREAD